MARCGEAVKKTTCALNGGVNHMMLIIASMLAHGRKRTIGLGRMLAGTAKNVQRSKRSLRRLGGSVITMMAFIIAVAMGHTASSGVRRMR